MKKTFHDKVIYQVYPKSWKDTTGNGIGDLQGVIDTLPYLSKLGVDMIWLNPFYCSPQKDNGYDISNYTEIDKRYGNFDTFDQLVRQAHTYQIDIMLDMVLNHVSIEHEWFQKALKGDKHYKDYFIIRFKQKNGNLPTNWQSKFGGPAWQPFGDTGEYYLCLFDKTQADLNWHNPAVRSALYEVVNFWLNKGVKGLRFDVLNVIGKHCQLSDAADGIGKGEYTDTPIVHTWIKELHDQTFGQYKDILTVGEMSSTNVSNSVKYSNPGRHELDMVFSFHHLKVDYRDGNKWTTMPFDFKALKQILDKWQTGMEQGNGWNAVFWNNHDQPRAISRFGNPDKYPYESATMLAATIHFLRGTPYIYQGEEIGMTNPNFDTIRQYNDVETYNAYYALIDKGYSEEEALTIIQAKSRDNSRTPMQWSEHSQAGFTTGDPWISVSDNYQIVNTMSDVSQRIFDYYRQLICLRKQYRAISYGSYKSFALDHPSIYAYVRTDGDTLILVLNHFYAKTASITIPHQYLEMTAEVLLGNYPNRPLTKIMCMRPYESVAYKLTKS